MLPMRCSGREALSSNELDARVVKFPPNDSKLSHSASPKSERKNLRDVSSSLVDLPGSQRGEAGGAREATADGAGMEFAGVGLVKAGLKRDAGVGPEAHDLGLVAAQTGRTHPG
jgi:hypothetical protein